MTDGGTDTQLPYYRTAVEAPLPTSTRGPASKAGWRACSLLFTRLSRPIVVIEVIEV